MLSVKSNWNKIILAAGLCAFSAAVAIADEQMQPASGMTNNVAGMDTNSIANTEPHHWWQFWKH
jgi:hypothetical protein